MAHYRELDERGISYRVHEYPHETVSPSEVARHLGIPITAMYKSLLVRADKLHSMCCIPIECRIDSKAVARGLQVRKVSMANLAEVPGRGKLEPMGVSPALQPDFPLLLDDSAQTLELLFIGGGRGFELEVPVKDFIRGFQPILGAFSITAS
ncbi:aminoacyl-tRNA deacylase [Nonomuraea rhizosphaerae]|uniref:aminoacyl-tRNA deacylase n=1 Tax=Nonomuraea rhizosphaerae TaxID=2665663 RepID=UPI001C5EC669|nr:YbaK/EbsC family protein [Nonomuraea rhizosphaerae]